MFSRDGSAENAGAVSPDVVSAKHRCRESRNDAQDRFKKTGGTPGPNVKMLGRWHKIAGNQGFVLAESSDAVAIGKWMQEWTDLLLFDVALVVNDEDVMKVLGA